MHDTDTRRHLQQVFRRIVLRLGGLIAVHQPEDEFVWAVICSLDQIFEEHLGSDASSGCASGRRTASPHPGVVELLARLDRYGLESEPAGQQAFQCAAR